MQIALFSPEHSWDHEGYNSLASSTETFLQNPLSVFQQMHSHACPQCSYCVTMQHSLVQSACFVFHYKLDPHLLLLLGETISLLNAV